MLHRHCGAVAGVQKELESINQREKFGTFHMADFVAQREQFAEAEWQDQQKEGQNYKCLLGVIRTRAALLSPLPSSRMHMTKL